MIISYCINFFTFINISMVRQGTVLYTILIIFFIDYIAPAVIDSWLFFIVVITFLQLHYKSIIYISNSY